MMESSTRVRISHKAVSVIHDACIYLLQLFSFFSTSVFRLAKNNGSYSSTNNNGRITNSCPEKDATKCRKLDSDKVADGVDPNEYFRLKFPTLKRIDKGKVASEVNDINGSRKSSQDWNEMGGFSKNHNQFLDGVENQTDEEFRACLDNIGVSSRDFRGELELHQVNDKMELESELSGYEEDRGSSEGPDDESSITDFWSEKDISKTTNAGDEYCAPCIAEVAATGKEGDNNEEPVLSSSSSSMDNEKARTMESMREHQELIEQLRMELKRSRIPSMPTIVEETESPRIMDDSKQRKTTENLLHERHMLELQKVFKIYREKMRRFDILNYQKMHSLGFLQLKNHAESTPTRNPSAPKLKSLVSTNIWMYQQKRHFDDPNKKLIDELQVDLEVVYVGQMCLSWEFLNWQYQKALDLCDSDPYEIHEYDATSGEFHQFQMLLRRFIDGEPLQGNRAEHFVQSRCILCKLLQVPVIKDFIEDALKHGSNEKLKDTEKRVVVTIDKLVRTVEESIRIFWQFVRADTHCIASNDRFSRKSELLSSRDLKLLIDVRKDLHKKGKKLKEILKEERCILKKLKRSNTEDDGEDDEDLYFLCQVDFILVSRVLNMAKITREQLIWCCDKLNKISFTDNKVYVEPALLFFPC